jgi:hypothetical protein
MVIKSLDKKGPCRKAAEEHSPLDSIYFLYFPDCFPYRVFPHILVKAAGIAGDAWTEKDKTLLLCIPLP